MNDNNLLKDTVEDKELVEKWIKNGAKPTDTVKRLIAEAK